MCFCIHKMLKLAMQNIPTRSIFIKKYNLENQKNIISLNILCHLSRFLIKVYYLKIFQVVLRFLSKWPEEKKTQNLSVWFLEMTNMRNNQISASATVIYVVLINLLYKLWIDISKGQMNGHRIYATRVTNFDTFDTIYF